MARLQVARLGRLSRQANLPLLGGRRRTAKACHWPWNVKSTIEKAELPQHKRGTCWENWWIPTVLQLHFLMCTISIHAEGCEKLLRRWTTVPSKNLQHLGSNMKCWFWFGDLKWSFAVNWILKLDYLQSSKHLNMLQIWSISSNARNNY